MRKVKRPSIHVGLRPVRSEMGRSAHQVGVQHGRRGGILFHGHQAAGQSERQVPGGFGQNLWGGAAEGQQGLHALRVRVGKVLFNPRASHVQ